MELVEQGTLTSQQWSEIVAAEREPWGGLGERLAWADKERYVALRAADGELVGVAGAGIVEVEVEGAGRFQVVGIGGVFVKRSERGRGHARTLLESVLGIASELGPDRAMLFCRPELMALYAKVEFAEISAPVFAEQPDGRIEMPMRAMWRPLSTGVTWPLGQVDIRGLPF